MEIDRVRSTTQQELLRKPNWTSCAYCKNKSFNQLDEFSRHLRREHCTVEGGSFVCRYGYNSVCNSLPVEGVSDLDYKDHILKHHAFIAVCAENNNLRRKQSICSNESATSSSSWMSVSVSQNLSAVLNDPGRGKQRDLFTRLWGTQFVETPLASVPPNPHLPLVTRAHFETYLRKISKRHRRHEQLASEEQPLSRRLRALEPLDIPPIFLQADFDLSRSTVFYTAIPFSKSGITVDGLFRHNAKLLQEKLTVSLDLVEMRIAEQVAHKSDAFFAGMKTHDTLMEQLTKALSMVRCLRSHLASVDRTVACQALQILRLQQRRANYLLVLHKLKLMRTVYQTQPQIQLLLSAPDYVAALELIVTSQDLLQYELAAVHSFRHLGPQLLEITRLIDTVMSSEFTSYATRDLNRPLTDQLEMLEQEKLVCIMLGMLRRGSTAFIEQYQNEAVTAVRALVKQLVLEELAESDCDTHGPLADRVQTLSLPLLLRLIERVTQQLAKLLSKIKRVHDVMTETIDMAAGGQADSFCFLDSKHVDRGHAELQRLLSAVTVFCHEESAKLLTNVTALDNAIPSQVRRLGELVENFSSECAAVSGRGAAALRAAFQVMAGRFVSRFHTVRKEKLETQLSSETWRAADVPYRVHLFVSRVAAEGGLPELEEKAPGNAQPFVLVGEEKFILIGSGAVIVQFIEEYGALGRELCVAGVVSHVLRDLVELLSLYNSRSCQLVLGAGAMLSAGLKTITSTNLVLCSRALQLLVWFLPHIRSHFQDLAKENVIKNGKMSVSPLDDVQSKMADHMSQLHSKVVLIVSSVIAQELLGWAAKPPVPSAAFRNLSRHLVKLHEAVSGILPSNEIESLYRKINDKFKLALREQIKKLNIIKNGGPQHGTVTSELIFYVDVLKKLNVLPSQDLSDNSLAEIWQA